MLLLCMYLFFPSIITYEVTTELDKSIETTNTLVNHTQQVQEDYTKPSGNTTFTTIRITQPSQTQKIERTLEKPKATNSSTETAERVRSSLDNFKPSPQLETYFEYNKFPVPPASPEPKAIESFNNPGFTGLSSNSWDVSSWSNSQNGEFQNSWYDQPKISLDKDIKPTQQSWLTRVKFPSPPLAENPYKFLGNQVKPNAYPTSFPTNTEGFAFDKPVAVEVPNRKSNKPSAGLWQKFTDDNNVAVQKTFLDGYNLMEKPAHYDTTGKDYDKGVSAYTGMNPWTKIVKLLTAIIPIGLFISALTPTVITVTAMNETQSRYRSEDNSKHQDLAGRLASSFKLAEQLRSCEDKILCELLVTASVSKNSEDHINNLLDTFIEHEDLQSKKKDLLKVFEAVKKGNCSHIVCKNDHT